MWDLLEELANFFKSDFAKDNTSVIIALIIFFASLAGFIVFYALVKFYVPYKLREAGDFELKYKNALEKIEELKEDLGKFKAIKDMTEAIDSEENKLQNDKALDSFLKEK